MPYAYLEAARFVTAAIVAGALLGLVAATIRTLRSSR